MKWLIVIACALIAASGCATSRIEAAPGLPLVEIGGRSSPPITFVAAAAAPKKKEPAVIEVSQRPSDAAVECADGRCSIVRRYTSVERITETPHVGGVASEGRACAPLRNGIRRVGNRIQEWKNNCGRRR